MKLICEIVQDLLPLYEDEICSEVSKTAVEEHLRECDICRKLLNNVKDFQEPKLSEEDFSQEDKVVVKSFRKVHRRWLISLLAMLLVVPTIFLSINQKRKEGICFTNLDELWVTGRYLQALEEENFAKAASYMNYETLYEEIQELLLREPKDFQTFFLSITLHGEEWLVSEIYYESFFQDTSEERHIWEKLICDNIEYVVIPMDVWEETMMIYPNLFQVNADGSYEKNDYCYKAIEFPCGTFMMETNNGIFQVMDEADFYSSLQLMPKSLYELGKEKVEAQAMNTYQYIQEKYGDVADMTVEEFEHFMKEYYAKQLQTYVDLGYSIKIVGIDQNNCYFASGNENWHIGYKIDISYGKNTYRVTLVFSVGEGTIKNLSAVAGKEGDLNESIADYLHLSYPEQ